MALAQFQDLIDIGAVPVGGTLSDPKYQRAEGLLAKAEALCVLYLQRIDSALTDEVIEAWPARKLVALALVIAEVAAQRLTAPATDTAAQLADGYTTWTTALLQPRHRRALGELVRDTASSVSLELDASPLSGLRFVTDGYSS